MSTRFSGFKNFSHGMVFISIIILGVIFAAFFIISIIGNVQLSCQNNEIKAPDIDKAQFRVYVKATRQTYYTNHYELIGGEVYHLNGYYEQHNGKYIYNPGNILINPYYFGSVEITKR